MLRRFTLINKVVNQTFIKSGRFYALAFLCSSLFANGQHSPLTSGTEFLSTYFDPDYQIIQQSNLPGFDTNIYTNIYLLGINEACVNIKVYGRNFEQTVFVPKDSLANVRVPNNSIYPFETPTQRAIVINSTAPINVIQGTNIGKGVQGTTGAVDDKILRQTEATTLLPSIRLNTADYMYFLAAGSTYQNSLDGNLTTIFYLIYEGNSTSVEVEFNHRTTLPPNFGPTSIPANSVVAFNLLNGEVQSFYSPTSLFSGNTSFNFLSKLNDTQIKLFVLPVDVRPIGTVPTGRGWVYEEIKPPGYDGTDFFTAPLAGNHGNQYSIMATKDSTVVHFSNVKTVLLDSLSRFDTIFQGPMHITSNKPVFGFLTPWQTLQANDNYASPFAVTMSSSNELITESLFCTLDEPDTLNNYIVDVVCKTNAVSLCRLDGQPINSTLFSPFPQDSSWSWANIELAKGVHKLQNDSGFHAHQYTWFKSDTPDVFYPSYGYNLPQSISWPQDSFTFRAGLTTNSLEPFANSTPTLCPSQPLYLQANHLRHTTWQWAFGDGTTQTQRIGNQRAKPISHSWQNPGQYWVTVTDSAGCSNGDSLLVLVENGPLADFSYTTNTGCSGTFVQLQNESMGATSYQWQWPGGNSTAQNPSFVYNGQDTVLEVTLIATDGTCNDTATQSISLNPSSFNPKEVPNVLTPNQDGVNDAFCIPGTAGYQDCYKLEIFNRWGSVVYQSQNPQDCWQPANNIATGVYFYVLTLGQQEYNGQVTVF